MLDMKQLFKNSSADGEDPDSRYEEGAGDGQIQ